MILKNQFLNNWFLIIQVVYPVFATDAAAQVPNPAQGTMTYSLQSDKIFIYNGTAW